MNRGKIKGTSSKYKNIHRCKKTGRWVARLWINKKRIYLGSFNTEAEAKEAIDEYKGI